MTLLNHTNSLSRERRYRLAIELLKRVIPLWDKYSDKHKLSYRDSVVGLKHTVSRKLPKETVESIEKLLDAGKTYSDGIPGIHEQYIDPVIALQDDDWKLPGEILNVFYSSYNLAEAFTSAEEMLSEDSAIYISINQSIDALTESKTMTHEEINTILTSIKD